MRIITLYLAAGLFNAAERARNLGLAKYLGELKYPVILPQVEALKFHNRSTGKFDLRGIARDCRRSCENRNNLYVGCADGPDADSGTCIEYGHTMTATGRAVVYRTDFRTDVDKELGVNGMFNQEGTEFVYVPCYVTELSALEEYHRELAQKIHEAVQRILVKE